MESRCANAKRLKIRIASFPAEANLDGMRARSNLLFLLLAFLLLGPVLDASKRGWCDAHPLSQPVESGAEDVEEVEIEFDTEAALAFSDACVPKTLARGAFADEGVSCWKRDRVLDQTAARPPPISLA